MVFACEECGKLGGRMVFGQDIRLCKDCKILFKFRQINKTKVIKEYGLKIEELGDIDYKEVGNPLFRNANNMILYKEKDIILAFINKYYKYIDHIERAKLDHPEENPDYPEIISNILVRFKNLHKKYVKKHKNFL